ncbi:hypothetical protein J6590_100163 [Homalodisca vitripennis]|nr:hypothetical protein J6590_100163 [Homalodisca vitripennis]
MNASFIRYRIQKSPSLQIHRSFSLRRENEDTHIRSCKLPIPAFYNSRACDLIYWVLCQISNGFRGVIATRTMNATGNVLYVVFPTGNRLVNCLATLNSLQNNGGL